MKADDFIKKFRLLVKFVEEDANKIVSESDKLIADLNRERLYNEGKDSDNKSMGMYKSITVRIKKLNRPGHDSKTSNITLKDTGSFYEAIEVVPVKVNEFSVTSTSETAYEVLQYKNFKNALGLTEEEANVVSEVVANKLVNDIAAFLS